MTSGPRSSDARQRLQNLLKEVIDRKASDLHLGPGFPPTIRINGELENAQDNAPLTPECTRDMAHLILGEKNRRRFEERLEADVAFALASLGRFRVNIYTQRGAINLACRLVSSDIPSIENLQLPAAVKFLAEQKRGLVLVSGVTGSGKSTTLAAMINHINNTRRAHIITIEDPIEYLHRNNKSIINQRELGLDTLSYSEALRNIVRQDPNVILIGEMRDLETATTALTAAQTGHLVFSTIHTTNTIQIVSRILDLFPPHQQAQIRLQLADTLRGGLSQRLLRTVDGKGRLPAVEVLINTPLVRRAIEENALADINAAMRQGAYYGMQTFNQALIALYERGRISFDEAVAAATSPEEFMLAARGITASHEQSQQKRLG